MKYQYGEEIEYECMLVEPEDIMRLQAFSCGNEQLDYYIHEELICDGRVNNEDGLSFKVVDTHTDEILAVFSLASSGIIWKVDKFVKILPAIKVDIFAVDSKYQKLHFDEDSMSSIKSEEHYYFSDSIMCSIIKRCREINDNFATVKYIILYADKKAKHFYERNMFSDFLDFMEKENNMEISKNYPMYMEV